MVAAATGNAAPPSGGPVRNEVEVTFPDGAVTRGAVMNFNPQRPTFFLHSHQPGDEATSREIAFGSVKMIAFLRGSSEPKKDVTFPPTARLVTVRFMDRETLHGVTQNYAGARVGLFLIPTARRDVERAYIPVSAIREVVSVKRLGEILAEQGMVTPDKIEQALLQQRILHDEPIGQILLKQQIISNEQLAKGLSLQQARQGKKIGEILLEQGFIDDMQLKEALALQQTQRGKKLGQIMVEMGCATYKMIGIALAIQYNVPFIDLGSQAVDPQLRTLIPLETARRLNVMPLSLQQKILTIAMTDPAEHEAEDELRARTGLSVVIVVATPQDISRALAKFYEPV